uniref:Uncharacterized protein n=1 Tax=Pediastrum duplex TaxID=3105 RepID=A0A2U8GI69_PEDDU|nr:hypothetical protein [Pediastrum duplex]
MTVIDFLLFLLHIGFFVFAFFCFGSLAWLFVSSSFAHLHYFALRKEAKALPNSRYFALAPFASAKPSEEAKGSKGETEQPLLWSLGCAHRLRFGFADARRSRSEGIAEVHRSSKNPTHFGITEM